MAGQACVDGGGANFKAGRAAGRQRHLPFPLAIFMATPGWKVARRVQGWPVLSAWQISAIAQCIPPACSTPRSIIIGNPPDGRGSDFFLAIDAGDTIRKVVLTTNGNPDELRLGAIAIETR